ncbi:MAG: hypothetical protein FK731_12035 [Asgard group archaeon]|nr:hypothetical protein [Asgard group archaeon]
MKTQQLGHKEQIVQDVWGNSCLECDCTNKPIIQNYYLKSEEVIVLTCPICDFTIVVVEVEKLNSSTLQEELQEKNDTLIATHQQF